MSNFQSPRGLPIKHIKIGDLRFRLFIPESIIEERIQELAKSIKSDYRGKNPIIICVLKGAILFTSDLVKAGEIDGQIDFVRLSSYDGTTSTEKVKELMSIASDIKGRHVLVIEDIVDTGRTLDYYLKHLKKQEPLSVELAALLLKPDALKFPVDIKYLGFKIPDLFVVGYGLDYNESGRGLRDIYQLDLPDVGLY